MLTIRLQRTGRENTPTYRIVVAEHRKPVKGKFLEIVGHYLPARDPVILEHNAERITHWVKQGAIPSDTVARILSKKGMKELEKFVQCYAKQKSKKELPKEEVKQAPKSETTPPSDKKAPEAPKAEAAPSPSLSSDVPPSPTPAEAPAKETSDTEKKES